ncbi:MAG TPA: hypothetical protein VGM91_09975 [Conexibacter sp.]
MKLEKGFTVAVGVDQAWAWLTDADAVASCISPDLRRPDGERVYSGDVVIAHNGAALRCRTNLRPLELDDDEHVARLKLQGRELGGAALGTGVVQGKLNAAEGGTRVTVSADFALAGSGSASPTLEQVAVVALDGFAKRLADQMQEQPRQEAAALVGASARAASGQRLKAVEPAAAPPAGAAPSTARPQAPAPSEQPGAVAAAPADRAGALGQRLGERAPLVGVGALLGALLMLLLRRPKRRSTVEIRYRW